MSYHFEPPSPDVTTLNVSSPRIAEWLDQTTWADALEWDDLVAFGLYLNAFEAAPDTVIFPEGDLTRCMAILVDGTVEIIKSTESLEKKSLAQIRSPQTFGEMSLIDGQPRSAEVKSATKCQFVILDKAAFDEMTGTHPKLAIKVVLRLSSLLSQRLRQVSGRLIHLV